MRTTTPFIGFAFGFAVLVAQTEARAAECAPPTPECHLANGTKLLQSDPKRAAQELLASFKLDERTETLTMYATALQADRQYARALDTWQRIILFRESEIEAAKEAMRSGSSRKRTAARAAQARAQEQSEQAATEIMKLWAEVARVRVVFPPGQQMIVSDDGVEIDASKEFLVNAGRDVLTFTRKDGTSERIVVEIRPGQLATVNAPKERAADPAKAVAVVKPKPEPKPKAEPKPGAKLEAKSEPKPSVVIMPTPELAATRFVEAPRSPAMSNLGIGLVATGVVGLGFASSFAYLAARDFTRAEDLGCNADGECPIGSAAALGEQSNDRARIAQISAIGGGALLVTGATLWILGRGKTRRTVTDVSVSVTPSSVGIGWSLK